MLSKIFSNYAKTESLIWQFVIPLLELNACYFIIKHFLAIYSKIINKLHLWFIGISSFYKFSLYYKFSLCYKFSLYYKLKILHCCNLFYLVLLVLKSNNIITFKNTMARLMYTQLCRERLLML